MVMGDDCHCDWTARAWKASLSSSDNTLPPSVSRVSSPLQGRTCRWARTELSRGLLNPESMEWSRRRSAGNGPSPWQAPRKKPAKAQTPAASARLQGQEIPVGHLWASTLEVGSSNEASLVDKPTSQPHTPMPASRCLTASASVPKPEWPCHCHVGSRHTSPFGTPLGVGVRGGPATATILGYASAERLQTGLGEHHSIFQVASMLDVICYPAWTPSSTTSSTTCSDWCVCVLALRARGAGSEAHGTLGILWALSRCNTTRL